MNKTAFERLEYHWYCIQHDIPLSSNSFWIHLLKLINSIIITPISYKIRRKQKPYHYYHQGKI